MLDITEVRVKKINKGNFLGYASVCIGNSIVVKEIKLFQGKDNKYILMPGQRLKETNRIRNFAYPIKEDVRLELLKKIIEEYEKEENTKEKEIVID